MKTLLKWFGIVVATLVVAVALFFVSMRFHDGPLAIVAGGAFKTGTLSTAPDDWSFLHDRDLIEFQTLDPVTSRTVWLGVHDRKLFLVSGYMTTGYGKLWKQWPHYLANDDRIILRIDGKLYEQRLERIMSGPDVIPVLNEFSRKYGLGGAVTSADTITQGHTWMFEVVDR